MFVCVIEIMKDSFAGSHRNKFVLPELHFNFEGPFRNVASFLNSALKAENLLLLGRYLIASFHGFLNLYYTKQMSKGLFTSNSLVV